MLLDFSCSLDAGHSFNGQIVRDLLACLDLNLLLCNSYDMNSSQEERDLVKEQKRYVLSLHLLGLSYAINQ
jgi:hypothetical protein